METEINAASSFDQEPAREDYPFWSYTDVGFFFAFAFPSLLLGGLLVRGVILLLRLQIHSEGLKLLPAQFIGYGFLFFALYLLLKLHYGRPFWQSLRWTRTNFSDARGVLLGFVLAIAVAALGALMETPDVGGPMKNLLSDRSSVLLLAIFSITLGPICEELAFRGFLQPLLVRSVGAVPGVVLASIPFGLLHLAQYAFSWRHALLITFAGMAFGWMRQVSGSTRASAVMHAAYNFLFFAALLAQGSKVPTTW